MSAPLKNPWDKELHSFWRFVSDFGDTAVTVPLAILVIGFLVIAGQPRLAVRWALVIIGCAGALGALKLASVVCSYPLAGSGLRSPSGHVAMSIAVYGGMVAVIAPTLDRAARAALIAAITILTIGIALSRIIIGYHTPLEVASGLVVGIAALLAVIAVAARYRAEPLPIRWLIAGALVLLTLFYHTYWPAEQAIHRLASWLDILRPFCS
jgi:membrane-associated phospholipid phosphatase